MYQPPEVFHLQEAVKKVKENLLPQKQKEPEDELELLEELEPELGEKESP